MARSKAGRSKSSKRLGEMPVVRRHTSDRNRRSHNICLRGQVVAIPSSLEEAAKCLSECLGIKCRFVQVSKTSIKLLVAAGRRVREELSDLSNTIARAVGYKQVLVACC